MAAKGGVVTVRGKWRQRVAANAPAPKIAKLAASHEPQVPAVPAVAVHVNMDGALRAFHDAQAAEIRALRSRLADCETALVLYVLSDGDEGIDEALTYIDRQLDRWASAIESAS